MSDLDKLKQEINELNEIVADRESQIEELKEQVKEQHDALREIQKTITGLV